MCSFFVKHVTIFLPSSSFLFTSSPHSVKFEHYGVLLTPRSRSDMSIIPVEAPDAMHGFNYNKSLHAVIEIILV